MKATDIVEAIERFFLDIIGIVIPGAALLFGLGYILKTPDRIRDISLFAPRESRDWVALVAVSYVMGHAVTSIGHSLLLPGIESLAARLKKFSFKGISFSKFVPKFIVPESELADKIKADPVFKATVTKLLKTTPDLDVDKATIKVSSWRNIAMSLVPDQRHTIYRFMFLSQLNLGIATVSFLLSVTWLSVNALATANLVSDTRPLNGWWLGLLVSSLWPFLERRYRFYSPAMQVPFSMALAEMQKDAKKNVAPSEQLLSPMLRARPDAIYLAGGFQSGWQGRVKAAVPQFSYLDPRAHGLANKAEYTVWDLEAVRRCSWVFAYLESTNPGGFALALEIGYAKALGKRVIFVDERSASDPQIGRYLTMISAASDVVFNNLEDGIDFLQKLGPLA